MEYIISFLEFIFICVAFKAIFIGSDYNIASRIRYGSQYTEAYLKNKDEFKTKWE